MEKLAGGRAEFEHQLEKVVLDKESTDEEWKARHDAVARELEKLKKDGGKEREQNALTKFRHEATERELERLKKEAAQLKRALALAPPGRGQVDKSKIVPRDLMQSVSDEELYSDSSPLVPPVVPVGDRPHGPLGTWAGVVYNPADGGTKSAPLSGSLDDRLTTSAVSAAALAEEQGLRQRAEQELEEAVDALDVSRMQQAKMGEERKKAQRENLLLNEKIADLEAGMVIAERRMEGISKGKGKNNKQLEELEDQLDFARMTKNEHKILIEKLQKQNADLVEQKNNLQTVLNIAEHRIILTAKGKGKAERAGMSAGANAMGTEAKIRELEQEVAMLERVKEVKSQQTAELFEKYARLSEENEKLKAHLIQVEMQTLEDEKRWLLAEQNLHEENRKEREKSLWFLQTGKKKKDKKAVMESDGEVDLVEEHISEVYLNMDAAASHRASAAEFDSKKGRHLERRLGFLEEIGVDAERRRLKLLWEEVRELRRENEERILELERAAREKLKEAMDKV